MRSNRQGSKSGTKLKTDDDEGGTQLLNNPTSPSSQTYDPTIFENMASRACYTRILDLLTEFGIATEKASQTFTGPVGTTFTGIYKAVTRIGLPIWKGVHEANNQPHNLTSLHKWTNTLNALDAIVSFFSTLFWLIGTLEKKTPFLLELEKYLLFSAVVFHCIKDTIQLYQKSLAEQESKKNEAKQKQHLEEIDRKLAALEEANQYLREDVNKVAEKTNVSLLRLPKGY